LNIPIQGGSITAILAKVPNLGAIVHPAIQKFLELEIDLIMNAQLVAMALVRNENPLELTTNTRNQSSK
jgi:hypothetical protein